MRRMLLFAGALAVCVPLYACDTLSQTLKVFEPDQSLSTVAPVTMATAKKGLAAVHKGHEAAGAWLEFAADARLVHGDTAKAVHGWFDQSTKLIADADALEALGDAKGVEDKVLAAKALLDKVNAQGT